MGGFRPWLLPTNKQLEPEAERTPWSPGPLPREGFLPGGTSRRQLEATVAWLKGSVGRADDSAGAGHRGREFAGKKE